MNEKELDIELDKILNTEEVRQKRKYLHSKDYYIRKDKTKIMYGINECEKVMNTQEKILSYRISKMLKGSCDRIYVHDLRFRYLFNGVFYLK